MIKVSEKLYRGPRPPNGLLQIKSLNFGAIINLEDGVYELFHDDVYEQEQPVEFGLRPYRFHLSDWAVPDPDVIMHILRIIQAENEAGRSVYIHCLHGEDRTGLVCAAYRIVMGWPVDVAIKEMYQLGFHKFPYFYWVPSLKQYEQLRKA